MKIRVIVPMIVGLCMMSCGHGIGKIDGLMEEGKYDEALKISDECLLEKPNDTMCLVYKAQILERIGKTGDAAELWSRIADVEPTNTHAVDRLLAIVREQPNPSLGLSLFEKGIGTDRIGEDDIARWQRSLAMADSLAHEADHFLRHAMVEDAAKLLRYIVKRDGGKISHRLKLLDALIKSSSRGGSFSARIDPLNEAIAIGTSEFLTTEQREKLAQKVDTARNNLKNETEAYEYAMSYQPYPNAKFRAEPDTSRYYPTLYMVCGEGSSAEIRVSFKPDEGQYVVSGTDLEVRNGPTDNSPVITTLSGRAGAHVIERKDDYHYVRIGDIGGWVRRNYVVEKRLFEFELDPRGSMELSCLPSTPSVNIEVNQSSYFRGEVRILPYLHYHWTM